MECALGDRGNMLYTSSIITYGRATGVVVATGMDTEMGSIAQMLDSQDELDTPLKRKLSVLGQTLTFVGLAVCVLIFVIGMLYQRPLVPQFLMAISLANLHHSGRSSCHSYDCHGPGSTADGKEKCSDSEIACCGNLGKCDSDLQR